MKIAFISYEYPPDTSGGGIGTYTQQVAELMTKLGNLVYVFTATPNENRSYQLNGVKVVRINANTLQVFRRKIVDSFSQLHNNICFDVIESAEYGADAYLIKQAYPNLPYLIKLHSPSYLIKEFQNYYQQYILSTSVYLKAKSNIKNFLSFSSDKFYNKKTDIEFLNITTADNIVSPSLGLAKKISEDWKIPLNKIAVVENPYFINNSFNDIPFNLNNRRITFIGKLSILKGLVDLAEAIPLVLKKANDLKFRFIGEDSFSPFKGYESMADYLLKKNITYKENIEIIGKVPLREIPQYLSETDIIICCSLWENYPTVILEAMSAGKIVIGSNVGGIPEIIAHKENGLLVNSKSPHDIAEKILWVNNNLEQVKKIATHGKLIIKKMQEKNILAQKILNAYKLTIVKCSNR